MSSSRHNRELQQEFRVWIENQKVKGLGSPDLSTKLSYVPQQRIAEHFKARRTISQLLQRLDPDQNLESHQDNIIKEYPKVLCILIIIGQGHLIGTFVRHASLGDTQLPFEHKPTHFPFADDGTDFFARFKEVQWQFCIQPLTYNMDRVYEDARILPIMTKDKIGNGGSSHIFKITLPQAYDELEPHDSSEKKVFRRLYLLCPVIANFSANSSRTQATDMHTLMFSKPTAPETLNRITPMRYAPSEEFLLPVPTIYLA